VATVDKQVAEIRKKLTYAADLRCPCGAGMAYAPILTEDTTLPQRWPYNGYWDCSAILDGTADTKAKHEAQLPFSFYEIKSENQPSANGSTTRPK